MIVGFRESFLRDVRKIKDREVTRSVERAISTVEAAATLTQVPHLKKLKHTGNFYRIRLGEYRCGLCLDGDMLVFVRCLHRKDIYRFFPRSQ